MPSAPISWQGTGVALATPFAADGAPDLAALERLVEYLIAGGVDYLVPLGTTGESVTLTDAEQDRILETVFRVNAGRLPVLVGCGGNDTAKVSAKLRRLDAAYAADGYLSVSPYYNRPTQEGIARHYLALAEATQRPLVLYNVPTRTGSNVMPDTVVRLAGQIPHLAGVKEASGSLEQGMAIVRDARPGFAVISGDDALALPGIACGYQGVISVVANCAPRSFAGLVRQALGGDFASAQATQLRLLSLIQLLFAEGSPGGVKAALAAIGIGSPAVRLPLAEVSPDLQQRIAHAMAEWRG